MTKKLYGAPDAAPSVLHGLRRANDNVAYPLMVDPQGGLRSSTSLSNKQQRVAYNSNGQHEYVAEAEMGVAEGDEEWLIQKLEYNSDKRFIKRTIAENVSWTDRASATYS